MDSLFQLFLRNPTSTSTSLYDHPFPSNGRFLGGGWNLILETNFFLLSEAAHGFIPGGILVLKVHWTPGYLALGVRRPLEPDLNPN